MEHKKLSNSEICRICQELSILLHAGVLLGEGISLLALEERGEIRKLLSDIGREVEMGEQLSVSMDNSKRFPAYVVGLVGVGERTGRTEQALRALGQYYERREQMDQQLRAALTYPAVLLMLMLVVIGVLLSQVLPIFEEVYASLGRQLTGVAGGLLALGQVLNAAMPVLCVILAAAAACTLTISLNSRFREYVLAVWRKANGDRGISRQINNARFAQALAMGLSSGLPLTEAVELCGVLLRDTPSAAQRCQECARCLSEGADLAEALLSCGMLPAAACRLLALGQRGGISDSVMEDIARRLSDEAEQAVERSAARVEPTLVLVSSLMVGAILLSVMLPLMDIMAVLG